MDCKIIFKERYLAAGMEDYSIGESLVLFKNIANAAITTPLIIRSKLP
jgi:hypothetical protein